MLTCLPNGNIEISVRHPIVYLDHCAVREVSSSTSRRAHFIETFRTRGTLMFSVMNMIEMASNSGESYRQIRDFLDSVEPYWILSDPDVAEAHRRELRGLLPPECFFVPLDIFAGVYRNLPVGTLRLGSALEALHDQEFRRRARAMLTDPSKLRRLLERARKRHERGEIWKTSPHPRETPMWIADALSRYLIEDGKRITENDVVDLVHACVPLRYAAVIVLDKAWANFARKLKCTDVQVFAITELDDALDAIREIDLSHFVTIQPETPRLITR